MTARPVVAGWAADAAPEDFQDPRPSDIRGQVDFDVLVGKVPRAAFVALGRLVIACDDKVYAVAHEQDCCESVALVDVCGDPESLVGRPILFAESVEKRGCADNREFCPFEVSMDACDESWTWQFVKIGNDLETLTVQFQGTSNGYYNESAALYELETPGRPS